METGKGLTRQEFDEVMRRAAELTATDPESEERGFSRHEVLKIGQEVGLPEQHLRRALAEVRTGTSLVKRPSGSIKALFSPVTIGASRIIDKPRDELVEKLDDFLVSAQLLQRVRKGREVFQYKASGDLVSWFTRATSGSRHHYIASSRLVDVRFEELEEGETLVEIIVDPGIQDEYRVGAVIGGVFAGIPTAALSGGGIGLLGVAVAPAVMIVGGLVVGVGVAAGVAKLVSRSLDQRCDEVKREIEGILDRLETGDGLETPAPPWRKWMKRNFGEIARDVMGSGDSWK